MGRLGGWLNSIHAHLIALALGVIISLTTVYLLSLFIAGPPPRYVVNLAEMARMVEGRPLSASVSGKITHSWRKNAPPVSHRAEELFTTALAGRLNRRPDDVRVYLSTGDSARWHNIENDIRAYGKEANPLVVGTFTLAVRKGAGWQVVTRENLDPNLNAVTDNRLWAIYLSVLLIVPLSLWFSARMSRSIWNFANAANRLGDGCLEARVPVKGPTEIRLAAEALNEMQARISRFVAERTSVMGAIAHDLRTPLNSLRFRLADLKGPQHQLAEADIRQMEQIISSTMAYVENEASPQRKERLDVGSLIEGLVDDYRDRGALVEYEGGPRMTVEGDIVRLRRLFTNLIDNALAFGTSATVSLRLADGSVEISVVDDGPGIAPDELGRVFEPFFRSERSRNRGTGGIGLGLAIALAAARSHGGNLELHNRNPGLCATVRLPGK